MLLRKEAATVTQLIIYSRWRLREGKQEVELLDLMHDAVIPYYAVYDPRIKLGLLHIADSPFYLATQRWPDHEAWAAFPASPLYEAWFAAYEPILEQWDALVELEEEWECEELL